MAFLQRLGGAFRRSASNSLTNSISDSSQILPALFMQTRNMSGSKLFIGGLAWETDEQTLKDAFSSFGEVVEAKIIMDRATGRSRGFGFISFTSDADAENALQAMDGKDLAGRVIRVDYATARTPGGGGRGGFGGGFGGGSYGGRYGGGGGGSYGGGGYGGAGGYGGGFNRGGGYGGQSSGYGGQSSGYGDQSGGYADQSGGSGFGGQPGGKGSSDYDSGY